MRVTSPAKINLSLRVGPIQKDGFHPVQTWMATIGLFDNLDFTLDTAGRVAMSCSDPNLACDESNLIVRATRLLQQELARLPGGEAPPAGQPSPATRGAVVRLDKSIPMGAGLGGGSSNAAMTLLALNRLWSLSLTRNDLLPLASRLGSDVAFFLEGPAHLCTGKGDLLAPAPLPQARHVLLMLPDIAMPTGPVYRQFDAMFSARSCDDWSAPMNLHALGALNAQSLMNSLQNDLEPPAFAICPRLGELRSRAQQCLARPVRMSGSGSSLFTLFDSLPEAQAASREIQVSCQIRTVVTHLGAEARWDI